LEAPPPDATRRLVQELRQNLDDLEQWCAEDVGRLAVLAATVGGGKTREVLRRMATELRAEGRRFLAQSHEQIEERKSEFAALGGTNATHEKGVGRLCPRAIERPTFRDLLETLTRRGWSPRGDLCPDCASRRGCPAFVPTPKDGVHFAPHAMPVGAPRNERVVFADEKLDLIRTERIEVEDFADLLAPTPYERLASWKLERADLARIAVRAANLAVNDVARRDALVADDSPNRFPVRASGAALARLLVRAAADIWNVEDGDTALFNAEAAWRERGGPRRTPSPPGRRLADGRLDPRRWPRGDMDKVFDALLRAGALVGPEAAPLRVLGMQACVVVRPADKKAGRPDPEVWFETREATLNEALQEQSILILDATGDLALAELQAFVGAERVAVRRVEVAEPEDVAERSWWFTWSFTRRFLFDRRDRMRLTKAGAKAVAAALRQAVPRDAEAAFLGVITHKPVAEVLQWAQRVVEGQDADGTAGARLSAANGGVVLAELRSLYEEGLVGKMAVAYYFNVRGTNQFNDADVLALLGDPYPDISAVGEDARVLGLDWQFLVDARRQAEVVQALGRARTIRRSPNRPVRIFFAGRMDPFGGQNYERRDRPANRPPSAATLAARALAELLWRKVGVATWRFVQPLVELPSFAARLVFVGSTYRRSSIGGSDANPSATPDGTAAELRRLAQTASPLSAASMRRVFVDSLPGRGQWVGVAPLVRSEKGGRPWRVFEETPGLARLVLAALASGDDARVDKLGDPPPAARGRQTPEASAPKEERRDDQEAG
jgi:hypothetical protein